MHADLASQIRTWRRVNLIKQARLAAELGVSQQAVSAWERGLALPSAQVLSHLRTMMGRGYHDALLVENVFVRCQSGIRALVDTDGARPLEFSRGFSNVWGSFCRYKGEYLEHKLINEMQQMLNSERRSEIMSGEIAVVSGVSERHVDVDVDVGVPFLHRWHICFRRYGARVVADMAFEPCAPGQPTGIDLVVRIDELTV